MKAEDYKLIPMSEITDEARKIAVTWMGCEDKNWIGQKHKLASDIMNYAKKYHAQNQQPEISVTDEDIAEPIQNALYATNAFTTDQCSELTDGILLYLKEAGFIIQMRDKSKTNLREELIKFGTKERTQARDIAYKFYDKFNAEVNSLESIGGETNQMLAHRRKEKADIARQIGNAISGSNALSGNETIKDRVTKEVDNYFKTDSKCKTVTMKSWDKQVDEIFEQDQILAAIKTEPCKRHKPFKGGYLAHQEYAENKMKHGAKQKRCNECGYWYFKNEF